MITNWTDLPQTQFDEQENMFTLENCVIQNEEFDELVFVRGKSSHPSMTVRNVVFRNIKVDRLFWIMGICKLENVVFENIRHLEVEISPHNVFKNVVFKGKGLKRLLLRPQLDQGFQIDDWIKAEWEKTDVLVDISELECPEVEVRGIPLDKVRVNPELYCKFDGEAFANLDLSAYPPECDFDDWKMVSRSLVRTGALQEVVCLPNKKSKYYDIEMEEVAILREAGVIWS